MRRADALIALCGVLASGAAWGAAGEGLQSSFPPGGGSRFRLMMDEMGASGTLVISIADSSADRLSVEYFFTTPGLQGNVEMWQQFVLAKPSTGPLELKDGFVFAKELKTPERIPADRLKGFDGVATADFFFANESELKKNWVADEEVEIPAGKIKAAKYRHDRSGQVVESWVSDEAKPIGLVKVVSTGLKASHRYRIELEAVLKRVGRKIDPAKAMPLSAEGAKLLAAPVH